MNSQNNLKDEILLTDPTEHPTDTISSVSWSPQGHTFAIGSWDSHARVYQVDVEGNSMAQIASFYTDAPCLCVDWHEDATKVFAGCSLGEVRGFDMLAYKGFDIGSHQGLVKGVFWVPATNTLCSVSVDKTVRFWDLRQSGHVGEIQLEHKPFCSDLHGNRLALGLSEYKMTVIDIVDAQKTQGSQQRLSYDESPLGTRDPLHSIKFMPDGLRLAFGTVGGRANISNWDEPMNFRQIKLRNVMTFKAHKTDRGSFANQSDMAYHVNSLFGNSKVPQRFLGSCGGEGRIIFWDSYEKNKILEWKTEAPVTCGEMSPDGNLLAYAIGVDWSRGISQYMTKRSEIHVRVVKEDQLSYTR